MATIKFLLAVFCFAVTGSITGPDRNLLNKSYGSHRHLFAKEKNTRDLLVDLARQQIGVREKTGKNDGVEVEAYLRIAGLKKPEPYCAAFISWLYAKQGFLKPRSGWSPDLFPASRLVKTALPADVLGIYFSSKKRIAHVGLVEKIEGDWCVSIEANTNVEGSNEGDGVYRKRRHLKMIYRIADWVTKGRRGP